MQEEITRSKQELLNSVRDDLRAMSMTWKKYDDEFCGEIKKMCTSVKEVTRPVVKTMDVVEETLCDQRELKDKGAAPSLNNGLLNSQRHEEKKSNNGNADEGGAACESENKEYRPENQKESEEETREAAYNPTEACEAAVPDMSTSNSKTDQVNVCSASKHVAEERLQVESGLHSGCHQYRTARERYNHDITAAT
ncbi:hypothetical protein Bpfe_027196 [Biomphalaria pfeifferi]|uniref:Uncharacterized protein n=1 Tax=Biomphalaria pfeifferi TaxID=112525 RepID=A0AAD8AVY7_BIOPF|nr:hypothetical protein Bpfe_027196 [Biomphalaria pfeifferi]